MLPRFLLALGLGLLFAPATNAHAQEKPPAREYRVLLVGNSLTYTNNLPALLRAVGASQGTPIVTETYAAPGGTLSDRWRDGHAAEALRARKFDVLVLQEMGGKLACLAIAAQQRTAPCATSVQAHEDFAALATAQGTRTLLFGTWARNERMQGRLNRGMREVARDTGAKVFDAAGAVASMLQQLPESAPYPDGTHPSTKASLLMALALYRDITGSAPQALELRVTAPLLPVNAAVSPATAIESQPGLAGTGKATVIPASLVEPLVRMLPEPAVEGQGRGRRGR